MVSIGSKVTLKYNLEPAVTIPDYLLVDGPDGHKYLRLRASSLPIVQLLTGAKTPANASLTYYEPFQKLIQLRNEQMDQYAHGNQEEGQREQLFEAEGAPKSTGHRLQNLPDFVNIHVGNTVVPVLIHGDMRRPKAADFTVKLDANLLNCIVDHIRANVEMLEAHLDTARAKKKAKTK